MIDEQEQEHRLYTKRDNLTLRRQEHRKEYMKALSETNASITPQEQSPQADRWWPGTEKTKWEQNEV